MGIADAFGREDRFEIKTESFIRMVQEAAKAEANLRAVTNMVNCGVPHTYIREMLTGTKEEIELIVDEEAVARMTKEFGEKEDIVDDNIPE